MLKSHVMNLPEIRVVKLYCLAIWTQSGKCRVFTYHETSDLIEAFCIFKDSPVVYHTYTFTQRIYIIKGHPLFKVGEPVKHNNDMLLIR